MIEHSGTHLVANHVATSTTLWTPENEGDIFYISGFALSSFNSGTSSGSLAICNGAEVICPFSLPETILGQPRAQLTISKTFLPEIPFDVDVDIVRNGQITYSLLMTGTVIGAVQA